MMKYNAFKYPMFKKNNKGKFYQEMWFFDVASDKIKFFLNFNINVFFGGLVKIADVIYHVEVDDRVTCNHENDGFYKKFSCDTEDLNIVFGSGDYKIKATSEKSISVSGKNKKFSFNFVFTGEFDSWKEIDLCIGTKKTDILHYFPCIPLGRASGEFEIDGKKYNFDGHGYHDHDWGYLNSIKWEPWILIKGKNVVASIVKTPMDSMLHYQDDEIEYIGKIDGVFFEDIKTIPSVDDSWINFPCRYTFFSKNNDVTIKISTVAGKNSKILNMGFGKIECIVMHDTSAISEIEMDYKGKKVKKENLHSTIYYWNNFQF